MNELGFLDYLIITAAVLFSWRMYHAAHPPPAEGENQRPSQPLLIAGFAPLAWTEPNLPQNVTPSLGETLKRICVASGYAGIGTFLDGAKLTYEAVIDAFAKGDMAAHAYLLSGIVRETFAEVIAARKERGETVELTFIGFEVSDIVNAGIVGGRAWIDVRFLGEMVSVTRDREGPGSSRRSRQGRRHRGNLDLRAGTQVGGTELAADRH